MSVSYQSCPMGRMICLFRLGIADCTLYFPYTCKEKLPEYFLMIPEPQLNEKHVERWHRVLSVWWLLAVVAQKMLYQEELQLVASRKCVIQNPET